jgi:hypothetical protein
MRHIFYMDVPDRIPSACVCSSHKLTAHVPWPDGWSLEAETWSMASREDRRHPPETTKACQLQVLEPEFPTALTVGSGRQDAIPPLTSRTSAVGPAQAAEVAPVTVACHGSIAAGLPISDWVDGLPVEAIAELKKTHG